MSTRRKLRKIGLFSFLILLLGNIPHLSFSQNNPSPQANPGSPDTAKTNPKTMPPEFVSPPDKTQQHSDTLLLKNGKKPTPPPQKLTPDQIKKIVGNDKVLGKDPQGHRLYQDSKGETYYISSDGTKVILK